MVDTEILKILLSEQAIYIKNLIESCLENLPNIIHIEGRLLKNYEDIIKILGHNDKTFNPLFHQRINSIRGTVLAAKTGTASQFDKNIRELFNNSKLLASKLDLRQEELKQVLKAQNQYIIDITLARLGGEYLNEIKIFDEFHIEMINTVNMFNKPDCNCYFVVYLLLSVVIVIIIFYLFFVHRSSISFNSSVLHPASIK